MPSFIQRVNTKGQNNWNWNAFKLGVNRACYCKFSLDKFYLLAYKSKVRRIKVTGSDPCPVSIKCSGIDFFYSFTINKHFTLLCIGAFRKALACLCIEGDTVTNRYKVVLFKSR